MENVHHGMKAKTIKSIIRSKVNDWIESITDEQLRKQLKNNVSVTGGCIVSMLLGEPVNDFDVYLKDHDTCLAVGRYYVDRFKEKHATGIKHDMTLEDSHGRIRIVVQSAGVASEKGTEKPYEYFEGSPDERAAGYVADVMSDPGEIEEAYQETEKKALETENETEDKYRPVFLSTNAITLSGKIQIVLRFYGAAEEIHANYDYVHCTCYWTSNDGSLTLRPEAMESMLARELRYTGSKYPVCSLVRMRKFIQRGWRVNAGQILKMIMQINELNLKDIGVLQDQLTGVDSAYFVQLIKRLREKDPEKVNAAYLVEIIDRMF